MITITLIPLLFLSSKEKNISNFWQNANKAVSSLSWKVSTLMHVLQWNWFLWLWYIYIHTYHFHNHLSHCKKIFFHNDAIWISKDDKKMMMLLITISTKVGEHNYYKCFPTEMLCCHKQRLVLLLLPNL